MPRLMHHRALVLSGALLLSAATPAHPPRPLVRPNRNVERAGVLRDGVLTVALVARESSWQLDGPGRPAEMVEAFAEPGKPPVAPGPLVRAPAGTEIRISVRNELGSPLTFLVPASVRGSPDQHGDDSIVVTPGSVATLSTRATTPGNYAYRATTPDRVNLVNDVAGALAGALVIDSASTIAPFDRVFVIMATEDSASIACDDTTSRSPLAECAGRRFVYTINGRSWPNTERVHATVGDSLHWRVINASRQVHPMHLHGFYYRVDSYAGPSRDPDDGGVFPGQMVVTQFMSGFSGMSMTWSPNRPGNWLFHCHVALHASSDSLLAAPGDTRMHDMAGLLIGTIVAPRQGEAPIADPTPVRHLRLVAVSSPAPVGAGRLRNVPTMHFVLEERGRRTELRTDASPEIDLVRGEPVAITIVNRLAEPTSVHWHGIEVEDSYMDGVAGFSGDARRLSPAIAPGDSFVARFAPPRAGTFMYHAHVDEVREDLGGMEGALIVRDRGVVPSPDDHAFLLKGDLRDPAHPLELDGQANPDTIVLHVGRPARFRLMSLASARTPGPTFTLTARPDSLQDIGVDTMLVRWRLVAKDGFDIPLERQAPRPASHRVAIGETYDFEYTPQRPGALRLEVRSTIGTRGLMVRVPIRVE